MKKILIVEDEKPLAHALSLKLEKAGFGAMIAFDGQEGLDLFEKNKFDLVLLDIILPKVDGFAFLEKMKAEGNKVPIIMTSNLSQPEDEVRAKGLGAVGYLIKSNTQISDIVKKVEEILK